MGLTLELNEIERLISYKPPVANLGDLYTRYPEGGQLGWFAYVSQLGAFAVWNGVSWEPNKSSDASGQYASMALAAQAAAEAALALIQTIQVDVELSAEKLKRMQRPRKMYLLKESTRPYIMQQKQQQQKCQ